MRAHCTVVETYFVLNQKFCIESLVVIIRNGNIEITDIQICKTKLSSKKFFVSYKDQFLHFYVALFLTLPMPTYLFFGDLLTIRQIIL